MDFIILWVLHIRFVIEEEDVYYFSKYLFVVDHSPIFE